MIGNTSLRIFNTVSDDELSVEVLFQFYILLLPHWVQVNIRYF